MQFRLLVEGPDDEHLVRNLLSERDIDLTNLEVRACGGVDTLLRDSLPTHLKASYDAVGTIVDADTHLAARWQAIRDRLTNHGYAPPLHIPREGLILTARQPAVGVWLMPDNTLPGMLEDFAQQLIAPDDALWPHAIEVVDALPVRHFASTAARKAQIHTWLAWQEEPGLPLGRALTSRYFQTNGALANLFVDWVRRLIHQS